ncbi:MAG: hypothetical protein ACYSOH_05280 [Planctomycetota bacterium]|jgi:fructose-1,6-bisphosphatase/sedoheptulose 1,7-bisphosphatase-like protein
MKKQRFENLISLARQESCPYVDVTDGVISAVSAAIHRNAKYDRTYTWMGAASAAMAACILVATTFFWQSSTDSVSEIMTYVSWVTQ